jgi:hypothetical protein
MFEQFLDLGLMQDLAIGEGIRNNANPDIFIVSASSGK